MRGLSPGRSRGRSPSPSRSGLRRRRKARHVGPPEAFISRSGSLRPGMETLSPLREGPDPNGSDGGDSRADKWGHWLCRAPSVATSASGSGSGYQRSDLRLLLGVLGAPLAPVHVSNNDPLPHLSIKDTPIVCLFLSLLLTKDEIITRKVKQNSGFTCFSLLSRFFWVVLCMFGGIRFSLFYLD